MTPDISMPSPGLTTPYRKLGLALLLNAVWINISEVFRYFALVMPVMRDTFPQISDVAPMNVTVFLIWGMWDTLLLLAITGFSWLVMERFGFTNRVAIFAGTAFWCTVFVILWLGLFNMNLATPQILLAALPLAWVEMVIAALLVRWLLDPAKNDAR